MILSPKACQDKSKLIFKLLISFFLVVCPATLFASGQSDVDSDGVTRSQELIDETDPNNGDSYVLRGSGTNCVDWNGYLKNLKQILELRNGGCSELSLRTQLRDISGNVQQTINFTLAPSEQRDIILNDLNSFTEESYGTVCSTILSGDSGALYSQLSIYDLNGDSFSFAYAAPFTASRTGSQYLSYNHLFPTLNLSQSENFTAGFIQISNEESSNQSGKVIYYSADGETIKEQTLDIAAYGRIDLDTHSIGANTVGMIEWRPSLADTKFRVLLTRYYFAGNSSAAPLISAATISAKRGSGYLKAAPFDTTNRISAVELSNTLTTAVAVPVTVYNAAGEQTSIQPGIISIPARATRHVVLNSYLPSGLGKVEINPDMEKSVIAALLEYKLNSDQGLSDSLVADLQSGFASTQRGSYNNFLGGCRIRLANLSSVARSAEISMKRFDGTAISINSPETVPAEGVIELDICSNDTEPAYGEVIVTPPASETLTGNLVRSNRENSAEFGTSLIEQSVCSTTISVSPATLTLVAASSTAQSFTVTNNSSTVTAQNIEAILPDSWSEVSQDASDCASVDPGNTCTIELTPGAIARGATDVQIRGTNTQLTNVTVSVAAPTASISVTGSPLLLDIGGVTGSLTITNTSTTVTASNVGALFTATALDGNVTETGNTCASIAPLASCTLTFTSGNTIVAATDFSISGDNTSTVTASLEIQAAALNNVTSNSGPASGGTGVTLSGTGLSGVTAVTFDGVAATSVNVIDSTTITAVTPAHAAGAVDVAITTSAGLVSLANSFTYLATAVGQSAYGGTIACLNGGLNNLIAAAADNSNGIAYGGSGIAIGAGGQSNTDGASNTAAIVAALGNNGGSPYAAQVCNDYEVDSQGNTPCEAGNSCYNDWFLPAGNNAGASGQLNCLYTNQVAIGGFGAVDYRSSTEATALNAFYQHFPNGNQNSASKALTFMRVRCVRAFTP